MSDEPAELRRRLFTIAEDMRYQLDKSRPYIGHVHPPSADLASAIATDNLNKQADDFIAMWEQGIDQLQTFAEQIPTEEQQ